MSEIEKKISKAEQEYKNAANNFNRIQEDTKKELSIFHEKLAQYSVAIISLSITFVGFLSSSKKEFNFSQELFYHIPLYSLLFLGWFLLASTLILGLLYRQKDASHLRAESAKDLLTKRITLNTLNGHKSDDDQNSKNAHSNLSKEFFRYINFINKFLPSFFVFGVVFILLFAIGSTFQLMK
jgi:hypothetical protein